jgi:hypothetical protein
MCWKIIAIITENARNNTRKNTVKSFEICIENKEISIYISSEMNLFIFVYSLISITLFSTVNVDYTKNIKIKCISVCNEKIRAA